MSEEELIDSLRRKETKGFEYVIKHYYPMCTKQMLQKGIRDEEKRKDIFSDSIIVLYIKLQEPAFTLSSKVSTYLYSVCENKTREFLRKEKSEDLLKEEFKKELVTMPDEKTQRISDEEIRKAIQELKPPCSELIIAFYFHKACLKELQQEMGYSSENTAKQAKYKCMQRLKNELIQRNHDQR